MKLSSISFNLTLFNTIVYPIADFTIIKTGQKSDISWILKWIEHYIIIDVLLNTW